MSITYSPDSFYGVIGSMRQFRAAARLLEACFDRDGCSDLSFERPDGTALRLVVPPLESPAPGIHERQVLAIVPDGKETEILRIKSVHARDDLSIELHACALSVQPAAAAGDEARDAVANLVMLSSMIIGVQPAARLTTRGSATVAEFLLYHAMSVHSILEHLCITDQAVQHAPLVHELAQQATRYHRLCEDACNKDDSRDLIAEQLTEIEDAVRLTCARLGAVGIRFNRDPRGWPFIFDGDRGAVRLMPVPAGAVAGHGQVARETPRSAARRAKDQTQAAPGDLQQRSVSPEVLEVLRSSRLDGDRLYLPAQLPRKLYEDVAEAIRIAGGKWVGGKTQAHVLGESSQAFVRMLATGRILDPKDYDFFATPDDLAREAVALAGIKPGMIVLEPSAGRGAIAKHLAAATGPQNVHAYELLPEHAKVLRSMDLVVHEGDFLARPAEPFADVCVMNPPFGQQADMKHVMHALRCLKPTGRLVAIVSPGYEHRRTKQANEFRVLLECAGEKVRDIASGTFKESGTDVRTVLLRFEADRLPWWSQDCGDKDLEDENQPELFDSARMRA
jgi:predicted RNA methylase